MSAQELAAKLQPGSTVRWDRMERAAFVKHPSVLQDGGAKKKAPKSNWSLIWAIPLVILYLFCYTAPIWGMAAISVSRFQTHQQPADERIPLSGTLFIFALLLLVVSFVHWMVTGRRRNGFYEVQAGLALLLGGMTAAAGAIWGVRESVDNWQIWIIPILASVVLAAVFLVFLVLAHISQDLPPDKIKLLKRRLDQVAQLSDEERSNIKIDIEAGVSDLERRGLISEAEADRARGAELGALALRMSRARASR